MRNRVVAISLLCGMAACSTDKDPFSDEEEDWSPLLDDADGDGFGSEDDCNDSESVIFPGAEELCDGIDNDCDGEIDENVTTTYFADIDGDGFGDASVTTEACQITDGWVLTGTIAMTPIPIPIPVLNVVMTSITTAIPSLMKT